LASLAEEDLARARLAEGHLDARAILAELARAPADGPTWGVWTAEPTRLRATPVSEGWHLVGDKRWCSGATALDLALVSATAPDGPRLFVVEPRRLEPLPGSWPSLGMEATASVTLRFDVTVAPGDAVGPPGAYVGRPGFWHGGAGVAACWFGGSVAISERLRRSARVSGDRSVQSTWGRVRARLETVGALLARSAAEIDAVPDDVDAARLRAMRLRLAVRDTADFTLNETVAALGAGALAHERAYAARVADLQLYVQQLRAEPAAAELAAADDGPVQW
jgi:alkylation response protein AidB-like acyl-CoA dehydrogenase